MGVTYKLKDEIVDCILRQKKENPQISCRKLVAVIEETFRISVSKSSVNAVIKEAHLSSPVGRTPSDKTPGFKIPHEKKVQLFGEPKPAVEAPLKEDVGPAKPTPPKPALRSSKEKPKVAPPPPSITKAPIVSLPPTLLPAKQDIEHPVPIPNINVSTAPNVNVSEDSPEDFSEEVKVSLLPDPVAQLSHAKTPVDSTESFKPLSIGPQEDSGKEYHFEVSSIGPALLRAALWDLMRRPALELFLKRHIGFIDEEIRILDVLLCLPQAVWEDASIALDGENAWIWPMSGFTDPPSQSSLQQLLDRVRQKRMASLDYFLELSYLFSMVDRVKIILQDRSELCLDGRLMFLNNDPQQKFLPCPVDKSVENVIGWMSADIPVFIYGSLSERFVDDLKNLIACCQNVVPKQIERIVLCDGDREWFSEFTHALNRRRGFVLFARMPCAQLEALVQTPLMFDPKNVVKRQDQDCMWAEFSATLPLNDDKIFFNVVASSVLAHPNNKAPEAEKSDKVLGETDVVFTNFTVDKMFINRFLENNTIRIPQTIDIEIVRIINQLREDAFSKPNEAELTLVEGFRYLSTKIAGYAGFLCLGSENGNDLFVNICKLKGSVMMNSHEIRLGVEMDTTISSNLLKIINFLNTLNIHDYNKRVLKLYIK